VPNKPLEAGETFATLAKRGGNPNSQMWFFDTSIFNKMRICLSKAKGRYLSYEEGKVRIKSNCPIEEVDSWTIKKVDNS
jgi:hypothetical protein